MGFLEDLAAAGLSLDNQAPQQQQPSAAPQELAPETGLQSLLGIDPKVYAEKVANLSKVPTYADGLAPNTPLNTSPLSVDERYKLALTRNEADRIKLLKQKFGDDGVIMDKRKGLLLRDQGVWHRADPDNFGNANAWDITAGIAKTLGAQALLTVEGAARGLVSNDAGDKVKSLRNKLEESNPVTKELMSEYAENSPTILAIGMGGVAAAATGGASLVPTVLGAGAAGAGSEAIRTSLGRLENTYDATPEQQLFDIGVESLINMGGAALPFAIKPTTDLIAKGLKAAGDRLTFLKDLNEAAYNGLKKVYGAVTVGEEAIDNLREYRKEIANKMMSTRALHASDEAYVDHLVGQNIKAAAKIADEAKTTISQVYENRASKLVEVAGKSFNSAASDLIDKPQMGLVNRGLAALKIGDKVYSPEKTMEIISRANGRIPNGARLVMRTQEELAKLAELRGNLAAGSAIVDNETYSAMKEVFNQMNKLRNVRQLPGEKGAEQLLKLNKMLDDLTYKFQLKGTSSGDNFVKNVMREVHDSVRSGAEAIFDKAAPGQFRALQETYSSMKSELFDVLKAAEQAKVSGSDKPFETLLNRLMSRGGKNVEAKGAFESVLRLAEEHGATTVDEIRKLQAQMRINQGAIIWNPILKGGMFGKGGAAGLIGIGVANPAVLPGVAAGVISQSPRANYHILNAIDSFWSGQSFFQKLGKEGTKEFFKDPEKVNMFVNTMSRAGTLRQKVRDTMLSVGPGGGQQ